MSVSASAKLIVGAPWRDIIQTKDAIKAFTAYNPDTGEPYKVQGRQIVVEVMGVPVFDEKTPNTPWHVNYGGHRWERGTSPSYNLAMHLSKIGFSTKEDHFSDSWDYTQVTKNSGVIGFAANSMYRGNLYAGDDAIYSLDKLEEELPKLKAFAKERFALIGYTKELNVYLVASLHS
jgi:hypothetical protein